MVKSSFSVCIFDFSSVWGRVLFLCLIILKKKSLTFFFLSARLGLNWWDMKKAQSD